MSVGTSGYLYIFTLALSPLFFSARPLIHGGGRARNSIRLFTLDSTQEIYIPNDNPQTSLQTYTFLV